MIDFYILTSPNVQKVFIMLEETGLPYKTIPVDVWKGEQFKADFVKLNPNSKIPVIVDHDGPGGKPLTVFESGAILLYLAEKTGKFLPTDMAKKYDVIQWLMVQLTTIGPIFGQNVHFKRFAPAGNDYAVSRFHTEMVRLYDLMEKRLSECAYLGGDDYSIADIATFPWARNYAMTGASVDKLPNLSRWLETVGKRPAVAKTLATIATVKSSRDTASDQDKDRIFGRGEFARA